MSAKSKKLPFWRKQHIKPNYDMALLRPDSLPKSKRFESGQDVLIESERSELLLGPGRLAKGLRQCREGNKVCDQPFCPICARQFRRWFISELLRHESRSQETSHVFVILLEVARRDQIDNLSPLDFQHMLRKKLERSGLGDTPVIGGFEIMLNRRGKWILHVNLVIIGGKERALRKLKASFESSKIDRAAEYTEVVDAPKQLSYVLKFGTYHRPYKQLGPRKSVAKPLNKPDHISLVTWMSQFEFKDFLFLFNARRAGSKIKLRLSGC